VTGLAATTPLGVTDSGGPVPTVFIDPATAAAGDFIKYNGTAVVWASIPAGGVSAVTASTPLVSSGGAAPNISLTGVVAVANGGTNSSTALNNNRALVSSAGAIIESNASTSSQVLVGGSPPAFGTVPNAALANSSITVTASTGLSGGGTVSLGGSTSLSVSYGTASGTATQGNDTRLPPTGVANGRIIYDNGTRASALPFVANAILTSNATTLSWVTTLPATSGGTGLASFGSAGELLYSTSTTGLASLAAGTSGYLLKSGGVGAPSWLQTVPVGNGGTGQTSNFVAGGAIYGASTSAQGCTAAGTAGQVLTSAGASAPTWSNPVTATASESVLGSPFTITGADGVFQDTGLSVKLPSAGTYLITAEVRGDLFVTVADGYIRAYLYNSTDAAIVANTATMCTYAGTLSKYFFATTPIGTIITVAASKTIKLYASRNGTATYTLSDIGSDATGYTRMRYVKIAP
jgi:hypothetical protein